MDFQLERVRYMPKELQPGVLYVAEEFGAAAHLCPCGCGLKIRTPLGPTEWSLQEINGRPSLHPSIGNWQKPCQSHYWIISGTVEWAESWTPERIALGRRAEDERRRLFFAECDEERSKLGFFSRVWRRLKQMLGRE